MQQIPVAMLDVHEIRPRLPGNPRCRDVILDQLLHFRSGEHLRVVCDLEFDVKNRMAEGNARFQALVVGPAETAGMRQLEANDQIVA